MSYDHALSALKQKRAELSGELERAEKLIEQFNSDLAALDRTIRIFDPTALPETIKPKFKREADPAFQHGEFGKVLADTLREATESLSVQQIAERIATNRKIEMTEKLVKKVHNGVMRNKSGNLISEKSSGSATLWRVAT